MSAPALRRRTWIAPPARERGDERADPEQRAPGRHRGHRAWSGRRARWSAWAGLALAIASLVAVAVLVVAALAPGGVTGVPRAQSVIEPEPGQPAPAPAQPQPAGAPAPHRAVAPVPPVAGQPLRVRIPAIGFTATVGSMRVPANASIDPPTPGSAYWIANYGTAGPASDNTVYIAGHTYRGGHAVFNDLLDVPHSAVTVHPGDVVVVTTPEGDYTYAITDIERYDKVAIGDASELWKRVPGRLALITCFQYNGGHESHQNLVVYAQLKQ